MKPVARSEEMSLLPDARTIQDQIRARLVELEALMAPLRDEAQRLQAMASAFAETRVSHF